MPHIRVRGLPIEDLESISARLIETLADLTETPNDHFTLEYQSVTYLKAGGASGPYPFFEILWFDRGMECKKNVARAVEDLVRPCLLNECEITVVFRDIKGSDYFENGSHF